MKSLELKKMELSDRENEILQQMDELRDDIVYMSEKLGEKEFIVNDVTYVLPYGERIIKKETGQGIEGVDHAQTLMELHMFILREYEKFIITKNRIRKYNK